MLQLIHGWTLIFGGAAALNQNDFITGQLGFLVEALGARGGAWVGITAMLGLLLWRYAGRLAQANRSSHEAEHRLRELEQRFHQVFDQAPFVVQRYAPDGTLRQTNQAWETVWGCSRQALAGYNVLHDPQAIAAGHLPDLQRAFAGESVTLSPIFYNPALNGNPGRCRWLEGTAYAIKNAAGAVAEVVLVTQDVSDRQHSAAALQQQAILLEVQQEIAQTSLNLDQVMTLILDRLQQLTPADGAVIEMVEGDELVYRAANGAAAAFVGARLHIAQSLSGCCVQTGEIIGCDDTETDPRVNRDLCRQVGIRSMIVVPLLQVEGSLGVVKVFSAMPNAFTERHIHTLQLMAGFLSNTLAVSSAFQVKAALVAALRISEERYASVIAAIAEGVILQDAEGMIEAHNASAEQILGLTSDQLLGRSSVDRRWHTLHEDGSPFPGEQHPAMVTLRTGVPCRNVTMGVAKPDGQQTWISINTQPLFHPNTVRPYAVVASFSDITERRQAEAHVKLLQTLALQIGEAPDFETALAQVLQLVCQTGWIYGEAWIPHAESQTLQCSAAYYINAGQTPEQLIQLHEFRSASEGFCFSLGEGIPGRVWASQRPEWQQNAAGQPQDGFLRQAIATQSGIKTGLGIPVVGDGQVLAVLVFFKLEARGEDKYLMASLLAIAERLSSVLQRKQMEQALFQEKELAQVTLQSIGDAVITTDAAGQIVYFNPIAEALTGWPQAEAQGLPLLEVFNIVNETTRHLVQNPVETALREGRIVGLANHTVLIARDGREIAIEDSAAPIRDRDGQIVGAVMVFHDVTQNRTLARQISWQASHDGLTGLVNRQEFERRVEQALISARLDHQVHVLCYLDLDRFKIVNDTCGHAAGDELLRQMTGLLQEKIRKTDTLARIGGDEFGVLLSQCLLPQALQVANELREAVQEFRFVWQEQTFRLGASIGLVGIDRNSESLAEMMSAADTACYTAKNRGRNRVYVVQTNDQELRQQRGEMQWVSRIAQALETDRFCLYAQPMAAITAVALPGEHYEVLLRLRDEQDDLILPMAFIPAAERYNLMHLIDRWVIRTLFKEWAQVVRSDRSIYAINLSGSSINDDEFIDFLHEQFATYAIAPQQICFEITETVAISNLAKASQFIQELQRLGCRFALDDFGAGMSSFAYLKSLPVDYLKIDGSFIRNILENVLDDAIVAAIIHVGSVMGIRTIAEFVENDAILERITTLGVDYAQGYGIAPPSLLIAPQSIGEQLSDHQT